MINLDSIINNNTNNHNEKWPDIQDHRYGILLIGGSGSRKTNTRQNFLIRKRFKRVYV